MSDRSDQTPRRITLEMLTTQTGLGPRQARKDVRKGLLPGYIHEPSGTYVCPPGEYDRWLAGDWTPRPQPAPVAMLHKKSA